MKTLIETLKQKSIKRYLAENCIYPAREYSGYGIYKSPFRNERKASFKVDYHKNLWCDFGSDEGGTIFGFSKPTDNFTIINEYVEPSDFGNAKLIYKELNETLFAGTIHYVSSG